MNTPLNTPNGTIVKIVSFLLSQRILMGIHMRRLWKNWRMQEVKSIIRLKADRLPETSEKVYGGIEFPNEFSRNTFYYFTFG